jgi:hypothetical protein
VQDLLLGMRLASAAGQLWLLQNAALAAWNAYVQLLQRQRYAELAGVLLPLLRQLLKVCGVRCSAAFSSLQVTAIYDWSPCSSHTVNFLVDS